MSEEQSTIIEKELDEDTYRFNIRVFKIRQALTRIMCLGLLMVGVVTFLGSRIGLSLELRKYGLIIGACLCFIPYILSKHYRMKK